MLEIIQAFGLMIHLFEASSIKPENGWLISDDTQFELCPQHRVYMHAHGCVICNNRI